MNNLWIETGYISLNHVGETLCGDKVEIAGGGEEDLTLVLADGLGSGVKANILSTLTSKILCTMISGGIPLENVLWSYNDILYEDGTVAVKGSKPLPVYA